MVPINKKALTNRSKIYVSTLQVTLAKTCLRISFSFENLCCMIAVSTSFGQSLAVSLI